MVTNLVSNFRQLSNVVHQLFLDNSTRLSRAIATSKNIKTMFEERSKPNEKFNELINNAKEVVFIGFGFDRDNMDRIGIPKRHHEFRVLFQDDQPRRGESLTIKWLNYHDVMKGLSMQWSEIKDMLNQKNATSGKLNIIESKANNITAAYQNDLKIFCICSPPLALYLPERSDLAIKIAKIFLRKRSV